MEEQNTEQQPEFTDEKHWEVWREVEQLKLDMQVENSKNVKMYRQIHDYLYGYYKTMPTFEDIKRWTLYAQSVYEQMRQAFMNMDFSLFAAEEFYNPYTPLWNTQEFSSIEDLIRAEIAYNCVAPYAEHLNDYYRGYQRELQELKQAE